MKVTELRIGNRVLADFGKVDGTKQIEVYQINESGVVYDEHLNEHCDVFLEPIPLAEEWLLKFGFKRFPWGLVKGNLLFKDKNHLCEELTLEIGNGNRTTVIYVHQLQNLYYALTGEEITMK